LKQPIIKLLLIEDNPDDAEMLSHLLKEDPTTHFECTIVNRFSLAVEERSRKSYDLILVDLELPDSTGLDTFNRTKIHPMETPIIVITGRHGEEIGLQAVEAGAQDYLVKGHINAHSLTHAIRYAVERDHLFKKLSVLSDLDELTGLYNRRGFFALSRHRLKVSSRTKGKVFLLFADFDDLKKINDTLGHAEGDRALIETAKVLRKTFRETDVIARLGGDEFAVLATEASSEKGVAHLTQRLQESLDAYNHPEGIPFKLSLSIGVAAYDPAHPRPLEELLSTADTFLYEQKRGKR